MVAEQARQANLTRFFADFHIHIGRAQGKPVKMAAAPSLTLERVLEHAKVEKGLDLITLVDGVTSNVMTEVKHLLATSRLRPVRGGGYEFENGLRVLLGSELETAGPTGGAAHFGAWFGEIDAAEEFLGWLSTVQKNTSLSSQRVHTDAFTLQEKVKALGGLFIVHHAFTPHKGLYGNCVNHLAEMVDPSLVDALELGLSADTEMADCIEELHKITFLSNSDAHSLPKIAREYNALHLADANFDEVKRALLRRDNRGLLVNYGLLPALGKYHRTYCLTCGQHWNEGAYACVCGSQKKVMGVYDRLLEIRTCPSAVHPEFRPPYIHQIPLEFVPGLGPKLRARLLQVFGTEMSILHKTPVSSLAEVVGEVLAKRIDDARTGLAAIAAGGGGIYGKLLLEK